MDPDKVVMEFLNYDGVSDLIIKSSSIKDAMLSICPEYYSDKYICACMMYAGLASHLSEDISDLGPLTAL